MRQSDYMRELSLKKYSLLRLTPTTASSDTEVPPNGAMPAFNSCNLEAAWKPMSFPI